MRTRDFPGEVQVYGIGRDGSALFAGCYNVRRICQRSAQRIARRWQAWRARYLLDNPGDYPLRVTGPLGHVVVFPVTDPSQAQRFDLPAPRQEVG